MIRRLIRRWLARLAGCTPEQIRARRDLYWWSGPHDKSAVTTRRTDMQHESFTPGDRVRYVDDFSLTSRYLLGKVGVVLEQEDPHTIYVDFGGDFSRRAVYPTAITKVGEEKKP